MLGDRTNDAIALGEVERIVLSGGGNTEGQLPVEWLRLPTSILRDNSFPWVSPSQ